MAGALCRKRTDDQANAARLGWLLIPAEQAVEVCSALKASDPPRWLEGATRLEAGAAFPGMAIQLAEIWAG